MKIEPMDICDSSTQTFKWLQRMTDEAQALKDQAKRIEEVKIMLACNIDNGNITDTCVIHWARSWLKHSTKTATEIMDILRENWND